MKWLIAALILFTSASSFGMTVLNQIKVVDDDDFSLIFNGSVTKDQIETEYLNDIIQVSLKGVSIYPAKIIPLDKGPVTKVFAYQYSPKLVRCRFSVKGKAEDFKGKFKLSPEGKSIVASFSSKEPVIAPISEEDVDEKALYEKVVKANTTVPAGEDHSVASKNIQAQKQEEETEKPVLQKSAYSKAGTSLWGVFLKLAGVIFLFLLVAVVLKKLKVDRPSRKSGLLGAITQFARGTLGKDAQMIQVVSSHYLDPKKSIAVVRIAGRLMVLGIANDSINLITQLADENSFNEFDDLGETRSVSTSPANRRSPSDASIFSDLLSSEKDKPALPHSGSNTMPVGARSRIRNRLEGMKPL